MFRSARTRVFWGARARGEWVGGWEVGGGGRAERWGVMLVVRIKSDRGWAWAIGIRQGRWGRRACCVRARSRGSGRRRLLEKNKQKKLKFECWCLGPSRPLGEGDSQVRNAVGGVVRRGSPGRRTHGPDCPTEKKHREIKKLIGRRAATRRTAEEMRLSSLSCLFFAVGGRVEREEEERARTEREREKRKGGGSGNGSGSEGEGEGEGRARAREMCRYVPVPKFVYL
jgi:hypothetical protein